MFHKYMHIERFGTPGVEGIEVGRCFVLPKLDGANASVWAEWVDYADGGQGGMHVFAGSRNRSLGRHDDAVVDDNHGFREWLGNSDAATALRTLALSWPDYTFFGEWLVPHTIRTYRAGAWRKFYVYDIFDRVEGRWLPHNTVEHLCKTGGVDFVPAVAVVNNPTAADLERIMANNFFLMPDGATEPGEGIVVKRNDYKNRFGHTVWAKLVRQTFKEENRLAFGMVEREGAFQVEAAIAEEYVTPHLVAKERSKVELQGCRVCGGSGGGDEPHLACRTCGGRGDFVGPVQPELLGRVFHCICTEELWTALKKHKNPTIDFKKLQKFVTAETKRHAPDLFGCGPPPTTQQEVAQ